MVLPVVEQLHRRLHAAGEELRTSQGLSGATVATTARGDNAELVRTLGADVVDYTQEDFAGSGW